MADIFKWKPIMIIKNRNAFYIIISCHLYILTCYLKSSNLSQQVAKTFKAGGYVSNYENDEFEDLDSWPYYKVILLHSDLITQVILLHSDLITQWPY